MAIEFPCAECSKLVRVAESAAGKKGRCPHCKAVVQIPAATPAAPAKPQPAAAPKPAAPPGPKRAPTKAPAASAAGPAAGGHIAIQCPTCRKTVQAPASMQGKRGRCPHCQTMLVLGTAPAADPALSGGLMPLDEGLTPIDDGLSPLGGNILDEIPPASPFSSAPGGFGAPANPLGVSPAAMGGALPPQTQLPSYGAPASYGSGPYSPYASPAYARPAARSGQGPPLKLLLPAIALMSIAVISLLYFGFQLLMAFLQPMAGAPQFGGLDPAAGEIHASVVLVVQIVVGGIVIIVNLVVLAGGVQMVLMNNYEAAKWGAIMGLVPCSLCCLNIPFAIWALIVLNQDDVIRRFG